MAYGFEIKNASGDTILDDTDTTMRVLHIQYVAYNTSPSFSVPSFDINKGNYYMRAHTTPAIYSTTSLGVSSVYDSVSDSNYSFPARSSLFAYTSGYSNQCGQNANPTFSWNNSTKVMSVTSAGVIWDDYSIPQNSGTPPNDLGNYQIVFVVFA